jgi:hypothetical protein
MLNNLAVARTSNELLHVLELVFQDWQFVSFLINKPMIPIINFSPLP